MAVTVTFNGVELTQWIRVTDVVRNVGANRSNMLNKVGQSSGKKWSSVTDNEGTVTIEGYALTDLNTKRRAIGGALQTSGPAELIISDEPDKYYLASVEGQPGMAETYALGQVSIKFAVPDDRAHAVDTSPFTNAAADNSLSDTLTIMNNGTAPTPVKVTAEFAAENGFLGLTLDNRYYQVGNTSEVNGATQPAYSQTLVPSRPAVDQYKLNDTSFAVIPDDQGALQQMGAVQVYEQSSGNVGHIAPSSYGTYAGPHGPALVYTLPADSNGDQGAQNFTLRLNSGLGTQGTTRPSDTRQVGQLCMTIFDKDKRNLCSLLYNDLDQNKSELTIRFDVNGKVVRTRNLKNTGGFTGHSYIQKMGNQFSFGWGGESGAFTFQSDELADAVARYVSFSFMQWKAVPLPYFFGLIDWNFTKHYTAYYKDLANYFQPGDVVTLDSATNQLLINDFVNWDRVDIGSQPLLAPPGESTLGIIVSDWADLPKVTAEIRERWV